MRILMLNLFFSPYNGGTEKHVFEVSKRLAKNHDVTVLTAQLPGTAKTEEMDGIHVVRSKAWVLDDLPKPLIAPIPVMPEHAADLKRLLPKHDILHAHNRFFYGLDPVSYSKKFKKPLYLTLHNARPKGIDFSTDFWGQAYDDTIGKTIMNACTGILGVSQNTLDTTLPKDYSGKKAVAYNGVDTRQFQPHQNPIKKQLGISKMILTVARMVPQKGLHYLIDACSGLDADLVLLGRGPLEKKLKKRAEKNHQKIKKINPTAQNRIHMITDVVSEDTLSDYYAAADVFCLPSLWEPFGMAACEAMASACPVVATRMGGLPEIIDNNENGFLVSAKDAQALREKIQYLLHHPNDAKKMGTAARRTIQQKFTWDKTADAYEAIYAD